MRPNAAELRRCKLECPDSSLDAPVFLNADGGFLGPDNVPNLVLKPIQKALQLPTLNFQVLGGRSLPEHRN
jgi:hypothetical protein